MKLAWFYRLLRYAGNSGPACVTVYSPSDLVERWRMLVHDWAAYVNGAGRPDV